MKQESTKYYTIVDVINKAVQRITVADAEMKEKTVSLNVITDLTYTNIWNSFVRWCIEQTELGYLLNIFPFANMFYVSQKNFEGIILKLTDYFMKECGVKWDETNTSYQKHYQNKYNSKQPQLQKLNYIAISSEVNSPKVLVQNGLNNLFHSIGALMISEANIQIDLGPLGLLLCVNKTVCQLPNKIKNDGGMNKKATVKTLMIRTRPMQIMTQENEKEAMKRNYEGNYQQKCITEAHAYETTVTGSNIVGKKIIGLGLGLSEGELKQKKMKVLPPVKSIKNDRIICIPMDKNSWTIPDMLQSTFVHKYVPKATANPILFNVYSNTKAAPFTAEKTQIPITHRISSFYTLSLQNFIIDKTTKSIKRLSDDYFQKYKNVVFEEPATELEEYLYLLKLDNISEEKIKLKKETYGKYLSFIANSVRNDYLADIKEQWLKEIAKMSHRAYNIQNLERYDSMLNSFMCEIISDYKISMKKSILDYILKHPEQREKLGISVSFRKLKEYGEEKITRPSDNDVEWKAEWNKNKLSISNNLFIMCENVTKILNYYVNSLKGTSYIDLKDDETWPTQKLNNFTENQKAKLELEKKIINEDWRKYVENILKENKIYKDQLILYFRSVSGLMSSQLRKLIMGSIQSYYNYIKQFKQESYYTPIDVFKQQYNSDFPFQKSFLEIEIKESESKIHFSFSEDLNDIHSKLTNVVKDIIKYSQNVERPDNMFIKNIEKRSNLWQVPFKDSEVTKMYNEIDMIINQNLEVISKVTELYEPFEFVMKEKESIEAFLLLTPKREDFKKRIELYEKKLTILIEEMPETLYMSMIKINCDEINRTLREKLTEFINDLLKSIFNVNIVLKSKKLGEECEKLFNKFQSTIPNEETLFNLENDLDICRMETVPHLQNEYEDFLDWVFFYLSYDTYKVFDSSKETGNAFDQFIKTRHDNFCSIEISMKTFTEALENAKKTFTIALDEERVKVLAKITELVKDVDQKRNNINSEILNDDFDNYLKDLLDYEKTANECKRCLANVIKKEGFLGNPFTTEDERLETCSKDLEPMINYFSFIKAYKEEKKNLMEVPITIIKFKDINALIEQESIFDTSLHKISAYRPKIQKAKDEFFNFKHGIEMAKMFFPLCEQFAYLNVEETDIYKDNRFYCSEVAKLYPKYLQKDTPENTQNLFKNLRLQSILYLSGKDHSRSDAQKTEGLQKNDYPHQAELEKIVGEWQNVAEMYKIQGDMADEIDIEFQTEKYNNKEYLVIKHENYTTIKNILGRNITLAEEKLNQFDSPRMNIIIFQTMLEFKGKLKDLLEVVVELESKQIRLEEFMDKTSEIKKRQEGFQMLKQAENEFRILMEMIAEKKPKILSILRVKDDFKDAIKNVEKLINNIEKEMAYPQV